MVEWSKADDRVFRACDARNLMVMTDASLDIGPRAADVLDLPQMKSIYDRYPAAFRIGSMDSTGARNEE